MWFSRRSSLEKFKPYKVRLTRLDKLWLITSVFIGFSTIGVDISMVIEYWKYDMLLGIYSMIPILLPGCFHTFVQFFTFYKEPVATISKDRQVTEVGEEGLVFSKRKHSWGEDILLLSLNLVQVRQLYELYFSWKWKFITGAFLDARIIQAACGSAAQVCLQMYIIFRKWGFPVDWNWEFVWTSICIHVVQIFVTPSESPCFDAWEHRSVVDDTAEEHNTTRKEAIKLLRSRISRVQL